MLKCETFRAPALPPDEFARRLDAFVADYILIVKHLLSGPAYPGTSSMRALCDAIPRHELPDLDTLNRLVGWILFELEDRARFYGPLHLTEEQQRVLAAAWRLSDSMHGPRNH